MIEESLYNKKSNRFDSLSTKKMEIGLFEWSLSSESIENLFNPS